MLQRDYFLRLIEEFAQALGRYLEKNEGEKRQDMLKDLYRQYVGPYEVVRNLSVDESLQYADEQWPDDERFQRLDWLAELLYTEAGGTQQPLRSMLMEKAFALYDYVDRRGRIFSFSRRQHMADISRELTDRARTADTLHKKQDKP